MASDRNGAGRPDGGPAGHGRKVLLTGASGFIGRHIQAALVAAGHTVVPVSRRHGVDLAGLTSASRWRPHLAGVDRVIQAAGIIGETGRQTFDLLHVQAPLALFEACVETGVTRVVQLSALGADAGAFSAYHRSKFTADEGLRRLPIDSFVLRPSLVYGEPGDADAEGTSSALFRRLARWPCLPVVGDGRQAIQPIRLGDLVETVMRCLHAQPARRTLDAVGPEAITFADWLQRLRAAQGLPPARLLHVPPALVQALMRAGAPFSPMLRVDNLRMLQAGNVADVAPLAAFLGRMPGAVR
ncbi:NAD-dependent epimerase/dehydratase family protein [Leptothrix sp. BB-4]